MQHSVKTIGQSYEELSRMRGDIHLFTAEEFFKFALENKSRYSIVDNGGDLLVSTWYSGDLIESFRKSISS